MIYIYIFLYRIMGLDMIFMLLSIIKVDTVVDTTMQSSDLMKMGYGTVLMTTM